MPARIMAAKAMLHYGEEPCLIGPPFGRSVPPARDSGASENQSEDCRTARVGVRRGAGAIFFSGCNLKCVFCQNEEISHGGFGQEISVQRLADIMVELAVEGAATIDLVTPTPYTTEVRRALEIAKPHLNGVPVVYNCGGYESVEALQSLEGLVEIYLPDLKYYDSNLSLKYSGAVDYYVIAMAAIEEMVRQVGEPVFEPVSLAAGAKDASATVSPQMKRGVLIRHMVLPGCVKDSERLLEETAKRISPEKVRISLLRQYTPWGDLSRFPEINRRLTTYEYERVVDKALALGFDGYRQAGGAATMQLRPEFNLEGL